MGRLTSPAGPQGLDALQLYWQQAMQQPVPAISPQQGMPIAAPQPGVPMNQPAPSMIQDPAAIERANMQQYVDFVMAGAAQPDTGLAGQLLYQAQPMQTMTATEGAEQAAGVPFTPRMTQALREPLDPNRPLAGTPQELAGQHGAPSSSFADWTRAMMTRKADAEVGQRPNVVGPWVEQSGIERPESTYANLRERLTPEGTPVREAMKERATAKREKVELARAASQEDMTPSAFGPIAAIRQEITDNPSLAAQIAKGSGIIAAQGITEQGEAAVMEAELHSNVAYQMRVTLTEALKAYAAAGVAPPEGFIEKRLKEISDLEFPSPSLESTMPGRLPPGIATPATDVPVPTESAVDLSVDEAMELARKASRFRLSFIPQYVKLLELRGVDSLRAKELAEAAARKYAPL